MVELVTTSSENDLKHSVLFGNRSYISAVSLSKTKFLFRVVLKQEVVRLY